MSDQVPTFSIHEKNSMTTGSNRFTANHEATAPNLTENKESFHLEQEEVLINGELGFPELRTKDVSKTVDGKGGSAHLDNDSFTFGSKSQDNSPKKVKLDQLWFFFCAIPIQAFISSCKSIFVYYTLYE